ncbi:7826_t:CDS:2 [Dentiscutata erythropus]|uniref:L-glutamate gamma-semialdehyde dehydrogenase n=1 Tax=Dentiscutata erythropus TaxID=1348616 RepID=A0A9N9CRF6_9GLOM|nr:7826_t:CDS:2 [Dentiscutata erythropus]
MYSLFKFQFRVLQRDYFPGSEDRINLQATLHELKSKAPFEIPVLVNGEKIYTGRTAEQRVPSDHKTVLAKFHEADPSIIEKAIKGALAMKPILESYSLSDRSAIFLKAADLAAGKYRRKLLAATMLGQGKNTLQAEADAAAELIDFWRFNCKFAHEIYQQQPPKNSIGVWNRLEYRPLEGFIYAISPFNFTAIGGNLPSVPALMGNVILWKPSPYAIFSNWIIMEILKEAGLPDGVIQFIPGDAEEITEKILRSPYFHYILLDQPLIVGETGGKNFHVIHKSADVKNAVNQTIRGAFEYQGQKCSACSRAYIPDALWDNFREMFLNEISKNAVSFEKIKGHIEWAKNDKDSEIIAGGTYDNSKGYKADEYEQILDMVNETSPYALTGSIFAKDRSAIMLGETKLRHASGNFYINDKSTGAIVGQQPFGGSRVSRTNDKIGSSSLKTLSILKNLAIHQI